MVLPIYKIISLVIRVFSKPLVSYIKQTHKKNDLAGTQKNQYMRRGFIYLGNLYNKGQGFINKKFMKIQSQFTYKPLNDELAVEKGIQFFYQILFYTLVIGLPLYELNRGSNQTKAKSKVLDEKLNKIDQQLQKIIANQKIKQLKIEQLPYSPSSPPSSQGCQTNLSISQSQLIKQQIKAIHKAYYKINLDLLDHQSYKYRIKLANEIDYQQVS